MSMTRTEANAMISQCNSEILRLQAHNAHGQHDTRIANLTMARMCAARRLQDIKRGA